LSDLHRGQIFLPPQIAVEGDRQVIVVHEDVNGSVEHDDGPLDGRSIVETQPAKISGDEVVETVQERDRFLSEDENIRIDELVKFAEEEDIIPVIDVSLELNPLGVAN